MIASAHLGKSPPQGGEAAEPWLGSRELLVTEEVEAIDLCVICRVSCPSWGVIFSVERL